MMNAVLSVCIGAIICGTIAQEDDSLISAIKNGDVTEVESLIKAGANVNSSNDFGFTPLHWVMFLGKCPKILQMLLNNGANVNALDKDDETALNVGIENGKSKMISFLIEKGANVNLANKRGETPLHKATKYGFISIVGLLIRNGSYLNVKDEYQNMPLHLCLLKVNNPNHRYEIARLLVINGADVNAKNADNKKPLDLAITNKIKELLRSKGATN